MANWIVSIIVFQVIALGTGLRRAYLNTWDYDLIAINANSTNEQQLKIDFRVERIARGEFAFTGNIYFFLDIQNDTEVEAIIYRSATGSTSYKLLPFHIPSKHLYDFLNTEYKVFFMESLKMCSNMPQFTGNFQPPFKKQVYQFNKCKLSTKHLPQYMIAGYYKLYCFVHGAVEVVLENLVKVEPYGT